jgi:DNA-binding NarL/FixJ family response regulator
VPVMTKATIVLADDHPAFAGVCTRVLCSEYEVVASVRTGGRALAAVEEHDPDLLVLDLKMPDMSGLDVLTAIQERLSRVRIVVLTLHQERSIAEQALALGAYGFVTKSRMMRDLRPALRAAQEGESFCSPLTG